MVFHVSPALPTQELRGKLEISNMGIKTIKRKHGVNLSDEEKKKKVFP